MVTTSDLRPRCDRVGAGVAESASALGDARGANRGGWTATTPTDRITDNLVLRDVMPESGGMVLSQLEVE